MIIKADDDGPILLHEPSLFEIQCGSGHAFRILSAIHLNAARLIRKALDQHRYLAFLFQRDYFGRSDSSLSCTFSPQGLLCPGQMHPYLPFLHHRDYFRRPVASLACFFVPQGLLWSLGFIPILHFFTTGITLPRPVASLASTFAPQGLFSVGRIHLYFALLFHRDYFRRPVASLSCSFSPQGLLCPGQIRPLAESISALPVHSVNFRLSGKLHA